MPSHAARGSPAVKRACTLGSRAPKTERYQGAQSMEVARVLWKEIVAGPQHFHGVQRTVATHHATAPPSQFSFECSRATGSSEMR